jgi:hypothetical protein
MPFNEKGEFVRAYRSTTYSSPHTYPHLDAYPESNAGTQRELQAPSNQQPNHPSSNETEEILGCLGVAIGIPIILWLAWTFRGFVLIGLTIWAFNSLRKKM